MAQNPYVNKVEFGGDTLIDLTEDSVTSSNLLEGETAHNAAGAPITGTAKQGHAIQNPAGTTMMQRGVLQFEDMHLSDDSTSGSEKTKAKVVKEVTSAQFEQATEAGFYRLNDKPDVPLLGLIYPVGSIYLNTNNVNPATFLGFGTWTLMSSGYLNNAASSATGGSSTSGSTTLTTQQIPSHNHTATTESSGAHTHTATTQNTGAHTHTATTGSYGNHTHTATTQKAGQHTHPLKATTSVGTYYMNRASCSAGSGGNDWYVDSFNLSGSCDWNFWADNSGEHTHTLTTQNTGAHTHTLTTGSYGNHTHTLTTESKGNHTHTLTTQSIGGGEGHTHTVEPPYIRVYAFERTA